MATVEKCFSNAIQRKLNGEVSEDFLADFAHSVMTAETLLLHAVRLGPEMWDLIRLCPLGAGCRYGQPFHVPRPNDKSAYHPACRTSKSRAKTAKEPVTLKLVPKKK